MPLSSCPACGGRNFLAAGSAAALQAEVHERNAFVSSRLRRKAPRGELKDLTDFMHDGEARMLACARWDCCCATRNRPGRQRHTKRIQTIPA